MVLCLIADEHVGDRLPSALGYLQIGLLDEAVDVLLVAPAQGRSATLASGPTTLIPHHSGPWPFARLGRRDTVARIRGRIDAMPQRPPVIVHALTVAAGPLAV